MLFKIFYLTFDLTFDRTSDIAWDIAFPSGSQQWLPEAVMLRPELVFDISDRLLAAVDG